MFFRDWSTESGHDSHQLRSGLPGFIWWICLARRRCGKISNHDTGSHICKCDECNAFEAPCVRKSQEIQLFNLATEAPILPHLLFLNTKLLSGFMLCNIIQNPLQRGWRRDAYCNFQPLFFGLSRWPTYKKIQSTISLSSFGLFLVFTICTAEIVVNFQLFFSTVYT